jgi:hypothetical protein
MSELKEVYNVMVEQLAEAGDNITKFEEGNASAGTRARANMQNLKSFAQRIRQEVQTIKNNK